MTRRRRARCPPPNPPSRTTSRLTPIPLPTTPIPLRTPCNTCGHRLGHATRKAHNAVVTCAACGRYQYNAPRHDQIRWWGQTR